MKEFNRDEYFSECYSEFAHNVRRPHKHAELIKAWADGAEIQIDSATGWIDLGFPGWSADCEYRIKPESKPNWYRHYMVAKEGDGIYPRGTCETMNANLRLYFDGNTGMLINAELIGK